MTIHSHRLGTLILITLTVAGTLSLSACSAAETSASGMPSATASPTTPVQAVQNEMAELEIGAPVEVEMPNGGIARITVNSAKYVDTVAEEDETDLYGPPKRGSFLLLNVKWEALKGDGASHSYFFTANDSEGVELSQGLWVDGELEGKELSEGEAASGNIAFDAPKGPLTLSITDPDTDPVASFSFDPESEAKASSTETVSEASAATETQPKIGAPIAVDMLSGNEASVTVQSAKYVNSVSTNTLETEPTHGAFLLLDVLWETNSGETLANSLYLNAKDSEGHELSRPLFVDDVLESVTVPEGDQAHGLVAFDAPKGPITVSISDPLMDEAAEITINAK